MKNYILSFSLALAIVLAGVTIRRSVVGIGGSPIPIPRPSVSIGGSPIPIPPPGVAR